MKKDENSQALLLHCRCNYTHFVIGYNNIILLCHFYRDFKLYKNLSYPFIIEGDLKKKGSKFMLRRPDLGMLLFYELIESTITDYYSRFKYNVYKTIPESFQYFHLVEIRYIDEDECHIRSSLLYDNKIFISEREIKALIKFQKNLYRCIEISVRKYTVLKLSTPSITINCNIELIWDILRNMKLIHKYIHLLCNKINYNGEIIKKDLTLELINIKRKKITKSIAKVTKCYIAKSEVTKESIIELLIQKDNNKKDFSLFNENKIILRLYEFNGICSMYLLFFFFNIHDYWIMENFTKIKNKQLQKFKEMVENYKQNLKNNEKK